jgi:hypothetical protein
MASYIHSTCQRQFDTQAALDSQIANPLAVCRLNEGMLLTKGFNY